MEPLTLFGLGTNIMFSLGIIFAIVFIIFYMRQRFSDYNHKLNSMFQLISAMADELNNLKQDKVKSDNFQAETVENQNDLLKLVVSDDEEESDSDSDDSDDSDENTDTVDYNNVVINDNLENVIIREVTEDLANKTTEKNSDIKIIELNTGLEEDENNTFVQDTIDINKMNVKQLKDLATKKGLVVEQSAKKKDLIKLIEENDN